MLPLLPAACTGVYSDPTDIVDESHVVTGNKRIFATSTTYQGGLLGGLGGADDKCAARAATAGLTGTYRAWLSDSHRSAASRLTHATGSYALIDGTVVATSWTDLVATNLQHAIDRDELGRDCAPRAACGDVPGNRAWTQTTVTGTTFPGLGRGCGDWTELQHDGYGRIALVGDIHATDSFWTEGLDWSDCAAPAALYCLEQ